MTSAYLLISILKKSKIPKDQLKIFLSFLNQKALDEYFIISRIYSEQKKLGKKEAIDLIINSEISENTNNELSLNETNRILNNE